MLVALGAAIVVVAGASAESSPRGRRSTLHQVQLIRRAPAVAPVADQVMIDDGFGKPTPNRQYVPTSPRPGRDDCSSGNWSEGGQDCAFEGTFPGAHALAWNLMPRVELYPSVAAAESGFPRVETALDHGVFTKVPGLGTEAYAMPLLAAPAQAPSTIADTTPVSGASVAARDRNVVVVVDFWCQTKAGDFVNVDCLSYQEAKRVAGDVASSFVDQLPFAS